MSLLDANIIVKIKTSGGLMQNKNNNYIDVTKEWISKANPNSNEIKELNYWLINNKKKKVDGKYILLDYSKNELECAKWLEETFGGEIYMCPRVNIPEGIRTPDFIWNNEYWDLKILNGNLKNTIDNIIKKSKGQSTNFIIDLSNTKADITKINRLINKLFENNKRNWLETIIVRNKQKFYIFKRK